MNRQLLWVVIFSLISAAGGFWVYQKIWLEKKFVSATTKKNIPHFSFDKIVLHDLNNQPQHLSQWRKPVLIINLWAPWCAPCRREIPALIAIQKRYPEDLQVIGLSFDNQQNVLNFSSEYMINYPLLLVNQASSQINQFFGNMSGGLPFTAILDDKRTIRFTHSGEITTTMLEKQLKALK